MTTLREAVARYSAEIGADPAMVQGAGGNASWKEDDILWVKASGTWLADALVRDIFVPVALRALRHEIAEGRFDAKPSVVGKSSLRPSIETVLHAVMPQRVVMHTHPVRALARLVQRDAQASLQAALGDDFAWGLVDYFKPGPELGAAVATLLAARGPLDVVFLRNHGLIVAGDTPDAVAGTHAALWTRLTDCCRPAPDMPAAVLPSRLVASGYRLPADTALQALAHDPVALAIMERRWALYPDHIVFLGPHAPVVHDIEALGNGDEVSDYVILPGHGVFVTDRFGDNKAAMLRCFLEVARRQDDIDALSVLDDSDIARLLDWDAEKYRKDIAR